jgi:hypothetical protein
VFIEVSPLASLVFMVGTERNSVDHVPYTECYFLTDFAEVF